MLDTKVPSLGFANESWIDGGGIYFCEPVPGFKGFVSIDPAAAKPVRVSVHQGRIIDGFLPAIHHLPTVLDAKMTITYYLERYNAERTPEGQQG